MALEILPGELVILATMQEDMKILICTFSFPYFHGNVFDSRFVYGEAAGYAANGAQVTVLTPHFPGSPIEETLDSGIRVIRFRYFFPFSLQRARVPGKPLYNPGSLLALLQLPILCLVFVFNIFRYAGQANIIHAQWTLTALLALPAKWLRRKTLVVTARGSDIRLLPQWLNRFIFRCVDAAIDCFGPTSWNLENKERFPSNYIELPHMVLNDSGDEMPVELSAIREKDPDAFIIMYTGRFHPIKVEENKLPLFDLVRCAAILKKQGHHFHIVYIGEGEPQIMQQLELLITENAVSDCVTLAGRKTDVMTYMRYCDIGLGGIAFNGVSQEYTINAKPQILFETEDNLNSPWVDGKNVLFATPENLDDLTERLVWAMEHRKEIEMLGQQSAKDMKIYFAESREGGGKYMEEFEKLILAKSA